MSQTFLIYDIILMIWDTDIRLLNGEAVSRFFKNNVVTFTKAERVQSHETNLGSEKKFKTTVAKKNSQFVSFRKSIFV